LANIKSQIKRIRTNEAARERNKSVRSALKTHIRKFNEAVASGDFEAAEQARRVAGRALDKAASAGVIHENKAANNKSGMAIALAKAIAAPPVTEEAKKTTKKAAAKKAPPKKAAAKAEEAPAEQKPKRVAKAAAKLAERVKSPSKKAPAKKEAAKATQAEEAPADEKPKRASSKKKDETPEEPTEA
jgi:small subunit ribosomal protein S20